MTFALKIIAIYCLLSAAFQGAALAVSGDTFRPYVSTSFSHDSNLLRFDDAVDPSAVTGKKGRSDTIRQLAAGLDIDWKYSRQQVLISAELSDNSYDRFDTLNYQGQDVNARWNWRLGNHLSGVFYHEFNRSLASFADIRGISGNLRDQQTDSFELNWLFHPRWTAGIAYSEYSLEYSEKAQQQGDEETETIEASLYYKTPKGSRVGLKLSTKEGGYPNRAFAISSTVDNGYTQESAQAIFEWNYSVKSRFRFEMAYVERISDHLSQRDYDGVNKRFNYTWTPTVKTQLQLTLFQQTEPRDNLLASVSENEGGSITASWAPTAKITISGRYRTEMRTDLNDPGFVAANIVQLEEKNDTISLNINYNPHESVDINASYIDDRRNSTRALSDFDAQMVSLTATFWM